MNSWKNLLEKRQQNNSYIKAKRANSFRIQATPKPLAESTPRIRKEDVVKSHKARFNRR